MKRFVEYETHDYMDEFPERLVTIFHGETEKEIENTAIVWCNYLNNEYSGGTTKFIKVMSAEEARAYIDAESVKIKHPTNVDKEWVRKANILYNQCYTE